MTKHAASPPVEAPTPTRPSDCSTSTMTVGTRATPQLARDSLYRGKRVIGLAIGGWCGG